MAKAQPGTYRVSKFALADTDTAMDGHHDWRIPPLKQVRPRTTVGYSMHGRASMLRAQFLDRFFEPRPATGTWHYSPGGMLKLLQGFQTLPVKSRRAYFDTFSVDWAVSGALWYHYRISEPISEDAYWILFSFWLRRPFHLLVRGNSRTDHESNPVHARGLQGTRDMRSRWKYQYKPLAKSCWRWRYQSDVLTFGFYNNFDLSGWKVL